MKTMDSYNFKGKKAIVRVDFNVPLNNEFKVTDDTRIKAAVPSIKKIISDGGAVILMSHLKRPKNGPDPKLSLKNIVSCLNSNLGMEVLFANDCIGNATKQKAADLQMGQVLLLENLRFYKQETAGDTDFAKKLSEYANVYVNDAFGTAHRAHASTTIIAQFFPTEKMFGYLIQNELESINKIMNNSKSPSTAIIGGAKVSSKIEIITRLLDKIDHLIIGGGMAYTFVKAQGGKIGSSLVEDDCLETALKIFEQAKAKNVQIYLPEDTVSADAFSNEANALTGNTSAIPDGYMGLDIGPKAVVTFNKVIEASNTILWNGPMGVFEMKKFEEGTKDVALAVARATKNGAFSLVGGGDSVAAVNKYNLSKEVSYVSTGGGALLEYMEGKELPGIKAIIG